MLNPLQDGEGETLDLLVVGKWDSGHVLSLTPIQVATLGLDHEVEGCPPSSAVCSMTVRGLLEVHPSKSIWSLVTYLVTGGI
jgi:hypothetical protein